MDPESEYAAARPPKNATGRAARTHTPPTTTPPAATTTGEMTATHALRILRSGKGRCPSAGLLMKFSYGRQSAMGKLWV